MQTSKLELSALQVVLAFLGFYRHAIDGIWSAASIDAMKAFERTRDFLPAVPTFGMPFPYAARLPKGMVWQGRTVTHKSLTPEIIAEIIRKQTPQAKAAPAKQEPAPAPAVKAETTPEKGDDDGEG